MKIGTPLKPSAKKALLLGSGELGKEVVIELMRLGCEVIACDRYENAPAMQVAHRSYVFPMTDASKLREVILKEKPDLIIPEIEAIATAELVTLEREGFTVVPTAEAAQLTMDREGIRRVASEELGLPTARYAFANTLEELRAAADSLGFPCVIKPVMSSSGKGQSVAKCGGCLATSWETSQSAGRTGPGRIIVEEFIQFESEITLLTVRSKSGTSFCDPIGHHQKGGDYVESWQPHPMTESQLLTAQDIAQKITARLGGYGIFGVELFLLKDGRVLFSEVSPRPHDTGLVTLATQTWSEFALHARAILGLPITHINRYTAGASAAVRADDVMTEPVYEGVDEVFAIEGADLRIFGKPDATAKRRLAVVLAQGQNHETALQKAVLGREKIQIKDGAH